MQDQVHVSLVVFPQCDPSIVYGVFDTLWAAGRDFSDNEDNPIFIPRIVSNSKQAMELVTGVSIVPHDSIDEVKRTDIVFVPNVLVKSAACLRGLDRRLLEWIKAMHQQGAALYAAGRWCWRKPAFSKAKRRRRTGPTLRYSGSNTQASRFTPTA